jgi:hypothetical protein
MSMKYSNDTVGNRSRDLPVCSVVPQLLRMDWIEVAKDRDRWRALGNEPPGSIKYGEFLD